MMDTLPNFTPRVQQALTVAKELAKAALAEEINLTHLFLGIAGLQTDFVENFFLRNSVDLEELTTHLTQDLTMTANERALLPVDPDPEPPIALAFDSSVKSTLAIASLAAEKLKHEYVGIEHLMLAFLKHKKSPILPYLKQANKDPKDLIYDLKVLFRTGDTPPPEQASSAWKTSARPQKFGDPDILEAHTVNFNQLAIEGKIDTIVGKERELAELTEILCRRKKNNPILLGSAGVGKTALIEGLAQQIVKGDAADFLLPKTIYGLDLASLIAGTKYRGQFEDRLQKLVAQLKDDEHAIIFIDELHTLVGAGSAEGTLDAANILKPTLARGELTCIGATTFKEYKKNIEKDSALARRFQAVKLSEPDATESLAILEGIKTQYEDFHGVRYSPEVLKLIIDLALRYLPSRHMPDKAIDILDQSASRRKIKSFKRPTRAREIEKILNLSFQDDVITPEQEELFEEYKSILDKWAQRSMRKSPIVTQKDVIDVVASLTEVSHSMISKEASSTLQNLYKNLSKLVVGQNEALTTTSNALLRAQAGLSDPSKPMGSFLFLGPSGVGKTYTAKVLAQSIFGGAHNLIQVNMSEYSDKISSSRLIGAAPGYVGYDESGQLTEQVRQKPYSVILFDEIEKAHEEVNNLLLQILEEGKLTDNFGRDVDFSNALIICTGNIGSELFNKSHSMGFSRTEDLGGRNQAICDQAKKILRPELVNRFSEVVIFDPLGEADIHKIIKLELKSLDKRLKEAQGVTLTVRKKVLDGLASKSLETNEGARTVKSIIKKDLETPLAAFLNTSEWKEQQPEVTKLIATIIDGAVNIQFPS
jgi:ATP-dependent Clp protease ATP-binding subunit ClpC